MLEARDLTCLKGDRLLFRGLALKVTAGNLLRVAGANGTGKTSLLRLLCGLTRPEAGTLQWHGQSVQAVRDQFHQALFYLGHASALNDLLTPLENLYFTCTTAGDQVSLQDCRHALERIGLARQFDLPAHVLSQGQRRRIGLARLFLASHRPLWILDEPFTALDSAAVTDLAITLSAHCTNGGMVILTTHQDAPFTFPPTLLNVGDWAC